MFVLYYSVWFCCSDYGRTVEELSDCNQLMCKKAQEFFWARNHPWLDKKFCCMSAAFNFETIYPFRNQIFTTAIGFRIYWLFFFEGDRWINKKIFEINKALSKYHISSKCLLNLYFMRHSTFRPFWISLLFFWHHPVSLWSDFCTFQIAADQSFVLSNKSLNQTKSRSNLAVIRTSLAVPNQAPSNRPLDFCQTAWQTSA